MSNNELDEDGQQFLIQLFEQTRGDTSAQVSMYDVGNDLGLDRDTSSRVAETLMGLQLVEIRTLSGGIGISTEGADEVKRLMGGAATTGELHRKLTDQSIMDQISSQAVEQAAAELKIKAGNLGLDFEGLSELMADLKTIDAQLGSSRPKTAIIRECLYSLKETLEGLADNESLMKIKGLLGPEDR
ncbi:MAG: hypothetical protein OET63_07730 [Desulfobacterales bacterium]|jgi:hypothetical protein|nr:hypothetical protein [Desulfobacterales bacterium]